jgi:hypothetical protein
LHAAFNTASVLLSRDAQSGAELQLGDVPVWAWGLSAAAAALATLLLLWALGTRRSEKVPP